MSLSEIRKKADDGILSLNGGDLTSLDLEIVEMHGRDLPRNDFSMIFDDKE